MKKRFLYFFGVIIGILFVLSLTLFPTKARKLNGMWRAALNSPQGSITFYSTLQEGEDISENVNEYEYEKRSDGFYYKSTSYSIEEDGTRTLNRIFESFEDGQKIAFDGEPPQEIPSDVSTTPTTNLKNVIGGAWRELNRSNVKNIQVEKGDSETVYYVEFASKYKESEAGTLNSNVLFFFTKSTMTVTYSEQEKRIKKIEQMNTGLKNSTEHVPVSAHYILIFE